MKINEYLLTKLEVIRKELYPDMTLEEMVNGIIITYYVENY